MLILYCHNDHPLPPERWAALTKRLPAVLHPSFLRFVRWQDRQASMFGKLLLLEALQEKGMAAHALEHLQFNAYKRPFLAEAPDFSISHSGALVVLAMGTGQKTGIDVEEIRPVNVQDFRSVLCPEELARLQALEDPQALFFEIWTKKEAVIKAEGKGLYNALDTVNALGNEIWLEGVPWTVRSVFLHPRYACHLASDAPIGEVRMRKMDFGF